MRPPLERSRGWRSAIRRRRRRSTCTGCRPTSRRPATSKARRREREAASPCVYNFPADGEYVFKASLVFTRNTFLFGSTIAGEQLEIAVDGERVALFDINPLMKGVDNNLRDAAGQGRRPARIRSPPRSSPRRDGPIDDFLRRPERALGDDFVGQTPGLTGLPHLREFGIVGPYNVTGVSDTPSRRRIFVCRPARAEPRSAACARTILSTLARRAFRRPVSKASLDELLGAYEDGYARGGFDAGIRLGAPVRAGASGVRLPVRAHAGRRRAGRRRFSSTTSTLASRLSFFLWSSIPDDELLTLAAQSKLRDPARAAAAGAPHAGGSALGSAGDELRRPVAASARARERRIRTSISIPTPTTTCSSR